MDNTAQCKSHPDATKLTSTFTHYVNMLGKNLKLPALFTG